MRPRRIRAVIIAVFVGGIVGMIVGSIQDNNGTAMTFGIITAIAALGLVLITAVAGADAFARRPAFDEQAAAALEARIAALVEAGGDEDALRELVRESVRLGRSGSPD